MGTIRTLRGVGKAARLAAVRAPQARRLIADKELRANIGDSLRSANHLYSRLAGDHRLRRAATDDAIRSDVDELVRSFQSSARRIRRDTRRRADRRKLLVGAGLGFLAVGAAASLAYPRSRAQVTRVAGETRKLASAKVHDARERFAAPKLERAA